MKVLQKELPHEMQRREDRVAVITGEPLAVQEVSATDRMSISMTQSTT